MTKYRILEKLKEEKGFVSGQALCHELGVSRTAVWKAVNALKKEGYLIRSVTNKGYMLEDIPDIIRAEEITGSLVTERMGRNLICLEEVDSTNEELKRMYSTDNSLCEGTVVAAERQVKGKGRRGRSWENADGENIAFSIFLRPDADPGKASMLTIVAALAVADACNSLLGNSDCRIKWPNDVVLDGKKVCGILTEMSAEPDCISYVIVGIGVNVNTRSFPDELSPKATSLYIQGKKEVQRCRLLAEILNRFELRYNSFLKTLDLSAFRDEYNQMLAGREEKVRVLDPAGEYDGISKGIDDLGNLLVERADKSVEKVYSGEVSVRGIYGYV